MFLSGARGHVIEASAALSAVSAIPASNNQANHAHEPRQPIGFTGHHPHQHQQQHQLPDNLPPGFQSVVGDIDRDIGRTFPLHPLFAVGPKTRSVLTPAGAGNGAEGAVAGVASAPHSAAASAASSSPATIGHDAPPSPERPHSPAGHSSQHLSPNQSSSSAASSASTASAALGTPGTLRRIEVGFDNTQVEVSEASTPGLAMLRKVLLGFAYARPDVSYCQGVNYVAASLLGACCGYSGGEHVPSLSLRGQSQPPSSPSQLRHPYRFSNAACIKTLSILLALSDRYGAADVWRPGLPRLKVVGYALSQFMRRHVPLLHEHLVRIGMDVDILAAQWLLPLMSTTLPPGTLLVAYDQFIAFGWKAMFKITIALLKAIEGHCLSLDVGGVATLFRNWKDAVGQCADGSTLHSASRYPPAAAALLEECPSLFILFNPGALLTAANDVSGITRSRIARIEEHYGMRLIEKKAAIIAERERKALKQLHVEQAEQQRRQAEAEAGGLASAASVSSMSAVGAASMSAAASSSNLLASGGAGAVPFTPAPAASSSSATTATTLISPQSSSGPEDRAHVSHNSMIAQSTSTSAAPSSSSSAVHASGGRSGAPTMVTPPHGGPQAAPSTLQSSAGTPATAPVGDGAILPRASNFAAAQLSPPPTTLAPQQQLQVPPQPPAARARTATEDFAAWETLNLPLLVPMSLYLPPTPFSLIPSVASSAAARRLQKAMELYNQQHHPNNIGGGGGGDDGRSEGSKRERGSTVASFVGDGGGVPMTATGASVSSPSRPGAPGTIGLPGGAFGSAAPASPTPGAAGNNVSSGTATPLEHGRPGSPNSVSNSAPSSAFPTVYRYSSSGSLASLVRQSTSAASSQQHQSSTPTGHFSSITASLPSNYAAYAATPAHFGPGLQAAGFNSSHHHRHRRPSGSTAGGLGMLTPQSARSRTESYSSSSGAGGARAQIPHSTGYHSGTASASSRRSSFVHAVSSAAAAASMSPGASGNLLQHLHSGRGRAAGGGGGGGWHSRSPHGHVSSSSAASAGIKTRTATDSLLDSLHHTAYGASELEEFGESTPFSDAEGVDEDGLPDADHHPHHHHHHRHEGAEVEQGSTTTPGSPDDRRHGCNAAQDTSRTVKLGNGRIYKLGKASTVGLRFSTASRVARRGASVVDEDDDAAIHETTRSVPSAATIARLLAEASLEGGTGNAVGGNVLHRADAGTKSATPALALSGQRASDEAPALASPVGPSPEERARARRILGAAGMLMIDLRVPTALMASAPALKLPGSLRRGGSLPPPVAMLAGHSLAEGAASGHQHGLRLLPEAAPAAHSAPAVPAAAVATAIDNPVAAMAAVVDADAVAAPVHTLGLERDAAEAAETAAAEPRPDEVESGGGAGDVADPNVITYPADCPLRLDTTPIFTTLATSLAPDLAEIDTSARQDVSYLSTKITAARSAVVAQSAAAERSKAALAVAEARTVEMLGAKRAMAARLHDILTGQHQRNGSAGAGVGATGRPLPGEQALSPPSQPGLLSRGGGGLSRPTLSSSSSAGVPIDVTSPSAAASLSGTAPQQQQHHHHQLLPGPVSMSVTAAVKRYSSLLSALDEQVHEASAAWKKAVWNHTMEVTKLDELSSARDALMTSLVEVSSVARAQRESLLRRSYGVLVDLWRAQNELQGDDGVPPAG